MLFWATGLCLLLYVAPIFAVLAARARRAMPLWEVALTIPAVVAFDMLGVMTLARVVRLETAILVSRPLWLIGALFVLLRRRRRGKSLFAWPQALVARYVAASIAAGTVGFILSMQLSRPYHLWDRHWHVPLVTLLRAERVPFPNVFEPGTALHYHVTGDVLGAILQTLALGTINASLALSVAHDVMFALIAATTALLMFAWGMKRAWPALLGGVALLLQGPSSLRGKIGTDFYGYSFDSLLLAGFRPHVTLAGLLIVGIVGCAAIRLARPDEARPRFTAPILLACSALLAVTDEASLGILGLSLGVTWLFAPRVVASGRLWGIAVFLSLAGVAVGANLLFSGSLSPGGPVQAIEWVAARSAGTQSVAALPLTSKEGREAMFWDLLPLLACAIGFAAAALKTPKTLGTLVFGASTLAISLLLFTRLEVNHAHYEAQRFMIAPCFVVMLLALLGLARVPAGSFAAVSIALGLGLASFSTIAWLRQRTSDLSREGVELQHPNLHEIDCREGAGARLGEDATLVYYDPALYGAWVGCHPSFAAGIIDTQWGIKIFPRLDTFPQLESLDEMVPHDQDLLAACPSPMGQDPVCLYAEAHDRCSRAGSEMRRCVLTPDDRRAILGKK